MNINYLGALLILLIADGILIWRQIALVNLLAILSAVVTTGAILVALFLNWNLLNVGLVSVACATALLWTAFLIFGSSRTLAITEFEGACFGLEYIPDSSTEGYKRTTYIFFVPEGERKRYYLTPPHEFDGFEFGYFPADSKLLSEKEFHIVDTITRYIGMQQPTEVMSTLYVDPNKFTKEALNTFLRFVKQCYEKPQRENLLLDWLNNYQGDGTKRKDPLLTNTIFAIVFANLNELEPKYVSHDGRTAIKVSVLNRLYLMELDNETGNWRNQGSLGELKGRIFFYTALEDIEKYGNFGDYLFGETKFSSRYDKVEKDARVRVLSK